MGENGIRSIVSRETAGYTKQEPHVEGRDTNHEETTFQVSSPMAGGGAYAGADAVLGFGGARGAASGDNRFQSDEG